MRDKRIICRTELLDTITDERERLANDAALVAARGMDGEGVTTNTGIEVLSMLRAVYEIDLLRDEVEALTKHAPSAGSEAMRPIVDAVGDAIHREPMFAASLRPEIQRIVNAHREYLEAIV